MAIYTVHTPRQLSGNRQADALRFQFVREGFSWRALISQPFWLVYHRLWLALVGYLVVAAAALSAAGLIGETAISVTALGIVLLFGLEANAVRRWTYSRGNWRMVGTVAGDGLDACERRFFDQWLQSDETDRPLAAPVPAPKPVRTASAQHVVGLFPEPGDPR